MSFCTLFFLCSLWCLSSQFRINHVDYSPLIAKAAKKNKRAVVTSWIYLSRSLFLLAEQLDKQGRYAEALQQLDEAVAIYRQRSNKIGLWWVLLKRSEIYQNSGKVAQAVADAQDAYRLAEGIKFPVYLSKALGGCPQYLQPEATIAKLTC